MSVNPNIYEVSEPGQKEKRKEKERTGNVIAVNSRDPSGLDEGLGDPIQRFSVVDSGLMWDDPIEGPPYFSLRPFVLDFMVVPDKIILDDAPVVSPYALALEQFGPLNIPMGNESPSGWQWDWTQPNVFEFFGDGVYAEIEVDVPSPNLEFGDFLSKNALRGSLGHYINELRDNTKLNFQIEILVPPNPSDLFENSILDGIDKAHNWKENIKDWLEGFPDPFRRKR